MYWDQVIFAGLGTVGLVCLFMGGIFYFMYKDAQKSKQEQK
mgnify:CR=1 FL=1